MNPVADRALSRSFQRCGVEVVTAVPGHGATQVFESCRRQFDRDLPYSYHEEVAFGIAHGCALTGGRAAVLMKSHGFLKAANAVADALSAGTLFGLVIVVFQDPQGTHSDSVLDVEPPARELGLPVTCTGGKDVVRDVQRGLLDSEEMQLPHLVLMDADEVKQEVEVPKPIPPPTATYRRRVHQRVCSPLFAPYQHRVLEAKRAGEDWRAIPPPELPSVPDGLPPEYRATADRYVPFFEAFQSIRRDITTGDTSVSSLFCLPPYESVDLVTYMGGSIPLGVGARLVRDRDVWSLTGDFSFLAAGSLGLLEVLQRRLPLKVVLFKNRRAAATGGQPVSASLLETVLAGYGDRIEVLEDPQNVASCRRSLRRVAETGGPRILVADYGE